MKALTNSQPHATTAKTAKGRVGLLSILRALCVRPQQNFSRAGRLVLGASLVIGLAAVGIVFSFITMGIVQEKITKKTYGQQNLKNDLIFFPLALQTFFCLTISYCIIWVRGKKETSLLSNKHLV